MRLFAAILVTVTALACRGYDVPESVTEPFNGRHLTPIEGVWLWNSGALVTIQADGQGAILLTLVDSPDPLVETPQVIGNGHFGGNAGTYNLEFITTGDLKEKSWKSGTVKYVAKLTGENRISLTPYNTGLKVNAWRLIPYLFRFSVSKDKKPSGIDGAIKVWPPLGSPEFPVVL